MNLSFRPLVAALAATIILNACSDDKLENAGPLPLQLSGVVAKGLVVGGKVTAYPIDANGFINIGTPLGSDETDAKGEYSIDITGYNGPIALVMKPVTGSTTKCDVPTGCSTYAFGDLMPFDFSMETIIPNAAGGAISASVTPLTTMAAAYAKDLGLSTESAQVANEKVARLLGVTDILTTKPVDITDNAALGSIATSADALKYGYLAAAIARIAKTDNAGDTGRAMQNLADSFVGNGGELINNESINTNSTSRISLLEIAANAQAIMAANTTVTGGVFDATKTAIGMTASTAQAATADTRTLTNTDAVITVGDVTKAKAIVTELRTWAQTAREQLVAQVDPNSTGTINFAKKVDTAMAAGEDNFKSAFNAMALIGQAVGEAYVKGDGTHALAELLSGNPNFSSPGNTGAVVVSGTSVTITAANVNGNTVNLNLTAPAMSGMVFRLTTNTLSVDNPGVTWTSTAGGFIELQFDKNVTDIQKLKTETNLGDNELTTAEFFTLSKLTKISWNGGSSLVQKATGTITDPVSFTGTTSAVTHVKYSKHTRFEYDFVQQKRVVSVVYTPIPLPESINFTGTFAMTNDKLEATFEGYVRNAESFAPKQPLAFGSTATVGSYAFSNDDNTLTVRLGDNGSASYELVNGSIIRRIEYPGKSATHPIGAYASMAAFLASNNRYLKYLSAQIYGKGYYEVTTPTSWNPNGGDLIGTLISPDDSFEGATQWVDMDGKITFLADFADLPAATISLSADRTGWKAGKGTATVSYGNVVITIDGEIATADNEDEPAVKLAFLVDVAGQGRLEIYPDTASDAFRGTVKADGKIVGIIQKSYALGNPYIVKYKDGSFESVAF